MLSTIVVLLCSILSETLIHGYVYHIFGDILVPQPGAVVFIDDTIYGDMADDNGEYSIEIEPGEYTVKLRMVGMLPLQRNIELLFSDTIEVSFKISPGCTDRGAIITSVPRSADGYIVSDNGYPLSGLRLSLPCFNISDTTNRLGHYSLGPFDSETVLYIHLYDGSIDSTYTIIPCVNTSRIISISDSGRRKYVRDEAMKSKIEQ